MAGTLSTIAAVHAASNGSRTTSSARFATRKRPTNTSAPCQPSPLLGVAVGGDEQHADRDDHAAAGRERVGERRARPVSSARPQNVPGTVGRRRPGRPDSFTGVWSMSPPEPSVNARPVKHPESPTRGMGIARVSGARSSRPWNPRGCALPRRRRARPAGDQHQVEARAELEPRMALDREREHHHRGLRPRTRSTAGPT